MKHSVFSIYDEKACAHLRPFFLPSAARAIRAVREVVNTPDDDNILSTNSSDFTLFEIGTFDDVTGIITGHDAKKSLGCLVEFRTPVAVNLPDAPNSELTADEIEKFRKEGEIK